MDVESVKALAAEGGDEGGVDVQNGIGVGVDQLRRQDVHKPCQHHQANVQLLELLGQRHGHGLVGRKILPVDDIAGDARLFCPFQGEGVWGGGDDGGDLAVRNLAPSLGVDERLQIGAAAGDQHCDAHHYSCTSTPSSPLTTEPIR